MKTQKTVSILSHIDVYMVKRYNKNDQRGLIIRITNYILEFILEQLIIDVLLEGNAVK